MVQEPEEPNVFKHSFKAAVFIGITGGVLGNTNAFVTKLCAFTQLCAEKTNQTRTGVCSKEKKNGVKPRITGDPLF